MTVNMPLVSIALVLVIGLAGAGAQAVSPEPPSPADVKAAPAAARKGASGLAWEVLRKGKGHEHPALEDVIEVHYTGWTAEGRMFESSRGRGGPTPFPMSSVLKGWSEGLAQMVIGEKRRLWIPAALGFGVEGQGPSRPGGPLVYDVELVGIQKPPRPPVPPADVKAPPRNARRTDSGLAYRVLRKGRGREHPGPESVVEVEYSGWTTDGRLFDSTFNSGEPKEVPLSRALRGWTEGLQLMVPGEKTRFWIPASLAHGDRPTQPGNPGGMLVFDIELVRISTDHEREERD
jgi:FKBP-type peptidyl-prolyl cis-trans isomerase